VKMSTRDWALERIGEINNVLSVEPRGDKFVHIARENHPSFTAAIISEKIVARRMIEDIVQAGEDLEFIANIPKQAIWLGDAIALAQDLDIGWGGFGDLISAMSGEIIRGFQRREYAFVERGLRQHTRVDHLTRIYDRVFKISRRKLGDLTIVLVNEYKLTAEHVRSARETYGGFDAILKTNPNGRTTDAARVAANQLDVGIFSWSELFSRLHKL
jgi:hypothetical protein